jgi:hypothetical protein
MRLDELLAQEVKPLEPEIPFFRTLRLEKEREPQIYDPPSPWNKFEVESILLGKTFKIIAKGINHGFSMGTKVKVLEVRWRIHNTGFWIVDAEGLIDGRIIPQFLPVNCLEGFNHWDGPDSVPNNAVNPRNIKRREE